MPSEPARPVSPFSLMRTMPREDRGWTIRGDSEDRGSKRSPHIRRLLQSSIEGLADTLSKHAIIPQQQFAYTTGKNASDITLVIDAMDLLHSGRFDGFCLVSSDSDFTRLAARIREQGVDVFGFGEQKTPESFRQAVEGSCTRRTCLPALRTIRMPALLQSPFCPQRSHARHHEGHHADGKRRRVGAFGGSWKTTGQPGFRLRSQNFRLSQARRSGAKTNSFEIDHPKGAPCAFAQSPLPDHLRNRRPSRRPRHEKKSPCALRDTGWVPSPNGPCPDHSWIWILAAVTTQEEISGRSVARSRDTTPSLSDMSRTDRLNVVSQAAILASA